MPAHRSLLTRAKRIFHRHAHVRESRAERTQETCLLYTSDAADERSSVDLGGSRIIKKKKQDDIA